MSETSFDELLYFVGEGNTAFISAHRMPEHMLDFFFLKLNNVYSYESDTSQQCRLLVPEFKDNSYNFKFVNNNLVKMREWTYFTPNNLVYQTGTPKTLGTTHQNQINFIKIPYEDGTFFFHSNPYLFSNLAMFRFDGFTYAEDLIHHFPYGKIQWDIYNLYAHWSDDNSAENDGERNNNRPQRSVFQFIFQHQTLTWAFAILVLTALLYAFFKGKRKQNIIPATELKENSSLNYLETVSSLYLQERKHNKLIKLQKRSFIDFIANHYYIRSHLVDDKYITDISNKSALPEEKITDIFKTFELLSSQDAVSDYELIGLQQKIEYFYKNCK